MHWPAARPLLAEDVFELMLPSDQWMSTTSCSPQTAQPATFTVAVLPFNDRLVDPLLLRAPVLQLGLGVVVTTFVVPSVVVRAAVRAAPTAASASAMPAAASASAPPTAKNDLRTFRLLSLPFLATIGRASRRVRHVFVPSS